MQRGEVTKRLFRDECLLAEFMQTVNVNNRLRQPYSLIVVATALNAALYAVGAYATSYIPSPWGVGQFRPAVIIPALFATVFGPWAGGVGAALGTLIADSAKHGGLYFGSLLAAVPGNFVGFFMFGYILQRKFSWARFVTAANVTLVVANLIVAFLYVYVFKLLYAQAAAFTQLTLDALTVLSLGLTLFWFVTMLPFVLLVTPPLIVAVTSAFPRMVTEDLRANALKQPPKRLLASSMLVPGAIMIVIGLATTYTAFGSYLSTNFASNYFPAAIMTMLQLLFYASGAALTIIGITVQVRNRQ
jgi:hypothetical protein